MKQSIMDSVNEHIARAKKEGRKSKLRNTRSSLHSFIKTREQADRFMKLLKAAAEQE